jgi:hypothetical protein
VGYAPRVGQRIRLLFILGLALAVAPAVAVATRPSVSPVYQAYYKGFESGATSKLAVRFGMTIAENEIVPRGHWFAYTMHDIRLYTDCSQSPIRVPGAINTSFHRRHVAQRVHFIHRRQGVTIRGYLSGSLLTPRVRATARVARPRCHDVVSFTATWVKPRQ